MSHTTAAIVYMVCSLAMAVDCAVSYQYTRNFSILRHGSPYCLFYEKCEEVYLNQIENPESTILFGGWIKSNTADYLVLDDAMQFNSNDITKLLSMSYFNFTRIGFDRNKASSAGLVFPGREWVFVLFEATFTYKNPNERTDGLFLCYSHFTGLLTTGKPELQVDLSGKSIYNFSLNLNKYENSGKSITIPEARTADFTLFTWSTLATKSRAERNRCIPYMMYGMAKGAHKRLYTQFNKTTYIIRDVVTKTSVPNTHTWTGSLSISPSAIGIQMQSNQEIYFQDFFHNQYDALGDPNQCVHFTVSFNIYAQTKSDYGSFNITAATGSVGEDIVINVGLKNTLYSSSEINLHYLSPVNRGTFIYQMTKPVASLLTYNVLVHICRSQVYESGMFSKRISAIVSVSVGHDEKFSYALELPYMNFDPRSLRHLTISRPLKSGAPDQNFKLGVESAILLTHGMDVREIEDQLSDLPGVVINSQYTYLSIMSKSFENDNSTLYSSGLACRRLYYLTDSGDCYKCHTACSECFGLSHKQCIYCSTNFEASDLAGSPGVCKPKSSQPAYRKYKDPTNNLNTLSCHSSCLMCDGPTEFDCTACDNADIIQPDNTCGSCARPEWTIATSGKCVVCQGSCQTCDGRTSRSCLSCQTGNFIKPDGACEVCDKEPWYRSVNEHGQPVCNRCHSSCKACVASTSMNCTDCYLGRYLVVASGMCVAVCPGGTFLSSRNCLKCTAGCKSCTGSGVTECVQCMDSYNMVSGVCTKVRSLDLSSAKFDNVAQKGVFLFTSDITTAEGTSMGDAEVVVVKFDQNQIEGLLNSAEKDSSIDEILQGYTLIKINIEELPKIYNKNGVVVKINIKEGIENGLLVVRFKKINSLVRADSAFAFYEKQYLLARDIDYFYSKTDAAMEEAAVGTSTSVGAGVAILSLISTPQALLLAKLMQTIDIYLLIDIMYPTNFERLASMITSDPMDYIPNIFEGLTDNEGEELPLRFQVAGKEQHFLANSGSLLTFSLILLVVKLISFGMSKLKIKLMRRAGRKVSKILNSEFWFSMFESYQIDILLSFQIFIGQRMAVNNWSAFNIFCICMISIAVVGTICLYLFIGYKIRGLSAACYKYFPLRVKDMRDEPLRFLLQDQVYRGSVFQRYFIMFSLLRDMLLCILAYLLAESPKALVLIKLLSQFAFVITILCNRPYEQTWRNFQLIMMHSCYLILDLMYMILGFANKSISQSVRYNLFGFSMIAVVIMLFIVSFMIGYIISVRDLIKKWRKKKNGKVNVKEIEADKQGKKEKDTSSTGKSTISNSSRLDIIPPENSINQSLSKEIPFNTNINENPLSPDVSKLKKTRQGTSTKPRRLHFPKATK